MTPFSRLSGPIVLTRHPEFLQSRQSLLVNTSVAGETATTLHLSPATIETAASTARMVTNGVHFSVGAESYAGTLYEIVVRLRAERAANGTMLSETSPPVSVKRLTASGPCP